MWQIEFKHKTTFNTRYKCIVCDIHIDPLLGIGGPYQSRRDIFAMLLEILSYHSKSYHNSGIPIPGDPRLEMINDGMIGAIDAGYGSALDGNVYQIAICDSCVSEKIETGGIIFDHNAMGLDDCND